MTVLTKEQLIEKLARELAKLARAAEEMNRIIFPFTAVNRPRKFWICEGVSWPRIDKTRVYWGDIRLDESFSYLSTSPFRNRSIVEVIMEKTSGQPRKVLRSVRRIQAATVWCLARAEGRKRAAQEILRRQGIKRSEIK